MTKIDLINQKTLNFEKNKLYIFPLGGCGEFGMNLTCYIYHGSTIIVDAGSLFADARKLGVSSVIPSLKHPIFEKNKIIAYFITHGHEDHIGALPYLFKEKPAPIFASVWTSELIRKKFKERHINLSSLHTIEQASTVNFAPFSVEYIRINHSIPHAFSFLIKCGHYRVFHSGDFKIDLNPWGDEKPINLDHLKRIGKEGVDAFLCDSTNAHRPGPTPSERVTYAPLKNIIAQAKGKVYVTTFASNLTRLRIIAEICKELGKKLVVSGRSLKQAFEIADRTKIYKWPNFLYEEGAAHLKIDSSCVILISGCQGEFRASLAGLATGEHRYQKIKAGDKVVFSSSVIPGNEKNVILLIDRLKKSGAEVITSKDLPNLHVSGHAYQDDIKTFLHLLQPKFFVPVHGDFNQQLSNSLLNPGKKLNTLLVENGDVLCLSKSELTIAGSVEYEKNYIDEISLLPMSKKLLKERLNIGEKGLILLKGAFDNRSQTWVKALDISSIGVAIPQDMKYESWVKSLEKLSLDFFAKNSKELSASEHALNEGLRLFIRKNLEKTFSRKKPIVISQIWIFS